MQAFYTEQIAFYLGRKDMIHEWDENSLAKCPMFFHLDKKDKLHGWDKKGEKVEKRKVEVLPPLTQSPVYIRQLP